MKINSRIFMIACCVFAGISWALLGAEAPSETDGTNTELKAIIDDIASPMIAFDPIGNAIAVWYDTGDPMYAIYADRYVFNSGWQGKIVLASNVNVSAPHIAFDSMGNAFVIWSEDSGSRLSDIYVARYVIGSGWKPKVNISSTTMRATNPAIAIDAAGNAIVVWREMAINGYTIYGVRFLASSGWQKKIKLS